MRELPQTICEHGIEYVLPDGYYLPQLSVPQTRIGHYGRLHREYLKAQRPVLYQTLFQSGRLWPYLEALDQQAHQRQRLLIEKYAEQECVTERLKAEDPMAWVGAMENIRSRVKEVILQELIYQ